MPASPFTRKRSPSFTTLIPTPRRFLHCVACGTVKKERSYALCAECYRLNGAVDRGLFVCFARHAQREAPEIVAHGHTAHAHAHLMINRVHPETFRAWHPQHDYARVERSLRAQEHELALRAVPGHRRDEAAVAG